MAGPALEAYATMADRESAATRWAYPSRVRPFACARHSIPAPLEC